MKTRPIIWLLGITLFLTSRIWAATDPKALRMCRESGNLENVCLGVIKDASFMVEALRVCDDLQNESAKVRCLQIVSNDKLELSLLKTCDEESSDWNVLDCLKKISNKTPEQLKFRVYYNLSKPLWSKNYESGPAVWAAISALVDQAISAGYCSGYRYILPIQSDWKNSDCWSTRYYFENDGLPPDKTQPGQFPIGYAAYNHCVVNYRCVTE